jgi:hypothetical protein
VEERETNLKLAEVNLVPIQKKVDFNDNEASQEMEAVETSTVVLPSVPVENSFDTLTKLGQDIIEENTDLEQKSEQTSREFDAKIREKVRISIKKKVEAKLANDLITKEEADILEEELVNEIEETISEEMELRRINLDLGAENMQEDDGLAEEAYHHYYWGEEGELIFMDD